MSRSDDSVRVGLIGGTGIVCGAVMGAVVTIALVRREERARGSTMAPGAATTPKPPPLPPAAPGTVGRDELGAFYVVQAGDHGLKIAARLGYPGDVKSLVEANPELKGRWTSVQPGYRLRLPISWTTQPPTKDPTQ